MKTIGSTIRNAFKVTEILAGIVFSVSWFWILYSKLSIVHDASLPPALDAPQAIVPHRGGKLSYYFDDSRAGASSGAGAQHQRCSQRL